MPISKTRNSFQLLKNLILHVTLPKYFLKTYISSVLLSVVKLFSNELFVCDEVTTLAKIIKNITFIITAKISCSFQKKFHSPLVLWNFGSIIRTCIHENRESMIEKIIICSRKISARENFLREVFWKIPLGEKPNLDAFLFAIAWVLKTCISD